MRKTFAILCALAILAVSAPFTSVVRAADFPTKPITLINPWYAGSVPDFVSRAFSKAAAKHISQPMTTVIKSGGAGTIGIQNVLGSRPDGYTIGLGGGLLMTLQPHRAKLPWDKPEEFAVLGRITQLSTALVVHKDAPYNTVQELVDYMKANPGKVRIAFNGKGNVDGIAASELLYLTGVDAKLVPGATSLVPTLGRHAEAQIVTLSKNQLEFADQIKFLCVFSPERYPLLKDVPTAREAGLNTDGYLAYYVIFGPKKLPADIKASLEAIVNKTANDPEFIEALSSVGIVPFYEDAKTAEARLTREYENSKEMVQKYNLKEE